jgi:hypothetical protein
MAPKKIRRMAGLAVAAVVIAASGIPARAGTVAAPTPVYVTDRAPLGIDVTDEPVAKAGGGPVVLAVTGATLGENATEFAARKVSARVGGKAVPAVYVDRTHLKLVLPAIAAESAEVTLVHDGIVGEPGEVTLAPVVTGLSVKAATIAGGGTVSVRIAGLNIGDATGFRFGDKLATCTKQGVGVKVTFLCRVPPADEAGPVQVSFTSAAGTASRFTAASTFSYTN